LQLSVRADSINNILREPSLNKALVLELARCEYLARHENLIALGNAESAS
jgi:hypothetical protein